MYIYVCVKIHTYILVYMYIYICIYRHIYIHTHICTYIYVCVQMSLYIYICRKRPALAAVEVKGDIIRIFIAIRVQIKKPRQIARCK